MRQGALHTFIVCKSLLKPSMALQKAFTIILSLMGSLGLKISDFRNAHSTALSGSHLHHRKHAAATMRTRTYALREQRSQTKRAQHAQSSAPVCDTSGVQGCVEAASKRTGICDWQRARWVWVETCSKIQCRNPSQKGTKGGGNKHATNQSEVKISKLAHYQFKKIESQRNETGYTELDERIYSCWFQSL